MIGWKHANGARGQVRNATAAVALSLLVPGAMTATPLVAQSAAEHDAAAQPIALGQPKTGAFPITPPDAEDLPHDDYRLRLEQGQLVRIRMDSPDPAATAASEQTPSAGGFDTYLELRLEGSQEPLRTDDDSGEGLNSRIVFTAPTAGTYIIRARPLGALSQEQNRTYTLIAEALPPPPPPGQLSGSRVEGDLGEGSPEDESFEPVRYAAYWFEGRADERVQFEMVANAQGPSLQILDAAGAVLSSNMTYDTNRVQVITVLPETGRYLVRAQVPATERAHYTIELTRATTPQPRAVREIEVGETLPGRFTVESTASLQADGSGQIEYFYQLYELEVSEGHAVTAIVTAEGFDPVLEAGTTSVLGFVPALTGVGAGVGTSRLVINPFQSGTVVLRLRTSELDVGTFQLGIVGEIPPSP